MGSHAKKEVPCSLCPGLGHWITQNRHPVFIHTGGRNSRDVPSLVRISYRRGYESFTHPTECRTCHRPCFFYQNDRGSKVFFDSLGPPWPKHSCAHEEAPSPTGRQNEGYTPTHILDAIIDPKHQTLTLHVELLPSGKKLGLKLKEAKDITRIRGVMTNPFHVKPLSGREDIWLLNTFEQVGEN